MPYDYQEKHAAQAHQTLRKVKFTSLETKRLEMKVAHLDGKLMHSSSLSKITKDTPMTYDSFGHSRMLLADIRTALLSKIVESEQFTLMVEEELNKLYSDVERLVLKKYYLDGMSIDQISNELGYCNRHILRIKRAALTHYYRSFHGV